MKARCGRLLFGSDSRPPLLGQLLVIGVFVGIYDSLRDLAPARLALANANAHHVLSAERLLHLDAEHGLNSWLAKHASLGLLAGDWYDIPHFFVTLPLLAYVWYRCAPPTYRYLRNTFISINVIGFLVYLVAPLAPPRLLPGQGFIDVVATRHAIGGWSTALSHASDLYASMPSLHVAWALWCTLAVFTVSRRRAFRAAAVIYPFITTAVIVATANHWVLDAIAAVPCFGLSVALAKALQPEGVLAYHLHRASRSASDRSTAPRRILIVTASVGAGHDGAARELANRLRRSGNDVEVRDYLPMLPLRLGYFIRWFYAMQLEHAPGSYEWHYAKMRTSRIVMGVSNWFACLARHRMLRTIRHTGADAVVSTYPLASQALGSLRVRGRITVPTLTFVTDFSVHPAVVSRHVDLNLCITPAVAVEAMRLSGRPSASTGPMVPDVFRTASPDEAQTDLRTELGIPAHHTIALIVAGSWGAGNVTATVERIAGSEGITPVVVCGRNEKLRTEVDSIPGAIGLGWRSDMPRLLRGCDVVVENAGGLTAMEAMAAGVPVISHEAIPGHGGHNAAEMSDAGVTTWVRDSDELVPAIRRLAAQGTDGPQVLAGRQIFVADAAVVVAELARTADIGTALSAAGLPAGRKAAPAATRRRARTRRRVVAAGFASVSVFYLSTAGVAFATGHGVGVSTFRGKPSDVYVVVRMPGSELTVPALRAELRESRATVAIDQQQVRASQGMNPDAVLLTGTENRRAGWVAATRRGGELVAQPRTTNSLIGRRHWLLASRRSFTAVQLCDAFVTDQNLIRPNTILIAGQPLPPLSGGILVLVDAQHGTPEQVTATLVALQEKASQQGLALHALTDLIANPA